MAFFDPFTGLTQLIHDVELAIDQSKIDQVKRTLEHNAADVHHDRFKDLHVAPGAFGTHHLANELGVHHLQAHAVIKETLEGVLHDLRAFQAGLDRAETLIKDADESSAADLDRKRASDILAGLAARDTGSERNHEARNHVLGGHGGASA